MSACIRTLCVLSVFSGFLLNLTPEGGSKRVLRLLSCAAILAVLLEGLGKLELTDGAFELTRRQESEQRLLDESVELRAELDRLVIEREYRQYIEERAAELFAPLEALELRTRRTEEGYWVPDSVRIVLRSPQAQEKLRRMLETELGIAPERQEWEIVDGPESAAKEN